MMTTAIKWTTILSTALAIAFFFYIIQQPIGFKQLSIFLIAGLIVFPFSIILLYRINQDARSKNLTPQAARLVLIMISLTVIAVVVFFVYRIIIKQDAWDWVRFHSLGGDPTGASALSKNVAYAGFFLVLCIPISYYLKTEKGNPKSFFQLIPLLLSLLIWAMILIAYNTPYNYDFSG